jgi:hypothetical protein
LIEELSNWKPGMNLPDIPVEEVSEELERHLRETNFQVILTVTNTVINTIKYLLQI